MSEYIIYTDKNEDFECTVDITGASLRGSMARLILEMDDVKLVFDGKILGSKCSVPIKRLPSILEEGMSGKMKLEMILEDTYFNPWNSDFVVKSSKKVDVIVNENTQAFSESRKPKVSIKNISQENKSVPNSIKNKIVKNLLKNESKQKNKIIEKQKIESKKENDYLLESAITKLSFELLANDITYKNLNNNKKIIKEIFNDFFKKNTDLIKSRDEITRKALKILIEEK